MNVAEHINDMHAQITEWRHNIHAYPETAFDERRTSDFVAAQLQAFGLDVHRGLGETGVVGTLQKGSSKRVIGLRADMDALFIQEENAFAYRSKHAGKMHACGHDGHTAMLLGAAKYLAERGNFDGTIRCIFQPAEETGDMRCGGNAMIQDGLFEKFPVDYVFGMHNFPGLPVGHFAVRSGPMLASIDTFEFKILGEQNHSATQHESADPLLIAANIVQEFHTFKSRRTNPADPIIMSITQFQAGDPLNDKQGVHVLPLEAYVRGTVYTLKDEVRDLVEAGLRNIVQGYGLAGGAKSVFSYERGYPVLVNTETAKTLAVKVATSIVGAENIQAEMEPVMGAEDFAFMLSHCPGGAIPRNDAFARREWHHSLT